MFKEKPSEVTRSNSETRGERIDRFVLTSKRPLVD
jgi:hypothetical protein